MTTNKEKTLLLKALLFGYAEISVENTLKEYHNEFWYLQCKEVVKYLGKQKPSLLPSADRKYLDKKFQELVNLDADHFANKHHSSYLNMLTILEYLILEMRDTSLRVKFGHYNFDKYRNDLETNTKFKSLYFDSNKFLAKTLDKIGA